MNEIEQEGQPTPAVQGFEEEGAAEDNGTHPGQMPSVIDLLRQDQEELASVKEVYIPVRGYERSGIQIKYHLPDKGKELDDITRKVQREFKDGYNRNLYISIDTMIRLCAGLYCQPEGIDEPVELDPEMMGSPVMFDERLAKAMGLKSEPGQPLTARLVVRRFFGNNELAIINHAERLNRWLLDTNADLEREIWQMGE
jgi:hypothetical protein